MTTRPSPTSSSVWSSGSRTSTCTRGPTIWPLNRDAFDVADVNHAASAYPDLNFIVEHIGLPRLEDFCWIATQEPNVYGGFAVAMPFIHTRPRYFAQMIGECLYWIGEDRILFASDYAIWQPKWLIEQFADFQIPRTCSPSWARSPTTRRRSSSDSTPRPCTTRGARRDPGGSGQGGGRHRIGARERGMTAAGVVLRALEGVRDLELDQSLVELGFVAGVEVDEEHAVVRLRLPTYFCAPNFAFLMWRMRARRWRRCPASGARGSSWRTTSRPTRSTPRSAATPA